MREILFKAKRIDNGEWVEGCLVIDHSRSNLFEYRMQPVESGVLYAPPIDPETLCQFTGLCDKNGKRIWESDVVWLVYDGKEHIYQIVWDDSELDFKATNGEENYGSNFEYLLCCDEIEVIGNIFDQPELLREESDE